MNALPHVAALCALEHAYQPAEQSHALFHAAMLELTGYHLQHTPGYAHWLARCGVSLESFSVDGDWRRLPPLHARYLKQHLPLSRQHMATTELHSSGTSGQTSRMHYDPHSLQALMHMSDRVFAHHGWDTPQEACNYLLLSYEPQASVEDLGNARTTAFLCKYAPVARAVYALRDTGSGHAFDAYGVIRALQEFAEQALPVRIMGFPSFLWFALERMRALKMAPLVLHPDSLVLLGGGWKRHAAQEISKDVLYRQLHQQLGIAPQRCRDGYGAVEHGVPYIECAHHRFHVPTYARACVRDTRSMQVLGHGKPGLLHLLSPYIMSCPVHSIVLGDLATTASGQECGCGIATDCFVLHGRAGTGVHRNCALAASELIT